MVVAMFIVGVAFVLMSLGTPWTAEHGYKYGIGIKLCGTQRDPDLWRRTHYLARTPYLFIGFAYLLFGLLFLYIPLSRDNDQLASFILMPVTLVVVIGITLPLVKKAKAELEQEKRMRG